MFFTPEKERRNRRISAFTSAAIAASIGVFGLVRWTEQWPWIVGAALLVAGLAHRFFTRKFRRRAQLLKAPFPPEWREILRTHVAFYDALDKAERKRFENDVRVFLHEKAITGIGTEIDQTTRLLVAASAVIPIFGFPEWEYDNLAEVLVYPSSFDEDKQFEGPHPRHLLGMVHSSGALNRIMILSKPDLVRGFAGNDAKHVGIHEFAHLLDAADGNVDGVPAAIRPACLQPWLEVMASEMERLQRGRSRLDPYALKNRGEFFAVASEAFFKSPRELMRDHPELYATLKCVFEQDTSRVASSIRSMLSPSPPRTWRGAPCFCGSGRRYHRCCGKKRSRGKGRVA